MNQFIEEMSEVFVEFGAVQARRMFSGYGLFHAGLMFAIVMRDTLYLKADDSNLHYFHERGLGRFMLADGKELKIGYYAAPAEVLEDRGEAAIWARRSFAAALRAQAKRNSPRSPRVSPKPPAVRAPRKPRRTKSKHE